MQLPRKDAEKAGLTEIPTAARRITRSKVRLSLLLCHVCFCVHVLPLLAKIALCLAAMLLCQLSHMSLKRMLVKLVSGRGHQCSCRRLLSRRRAPRQLSATLLQ